jgi:hypothetical protein
MTSFQADKNQQKQTQFKEEQGYKIQLLREKDDYARKFETDKLQEGSGEMKSTMQTKVYVDLSKYKGEFLDQKRHGVGIYYYTNGDIYAGSWRDDVFEGYGCYIFSSGERYEGELKHGKKHGKGTYYYINGGVYEGTWAFDNKNGHGIYNYLHSGGILYFYCTFIKF